jgi:hypothetical protein
MLFKRLEREEVPEIKIPTKGKIKKHSTAIKKGNKK